MSEKNLLARKLEGESTFPAWKYDFDVIADELGVTPHLEKFLKGESTLEEVIAENDYNDKNVKKLKSAVVKSLGDGPHRECRSSGHSHLFPLMQMLIKRYNTTKMSSRFTTLVELMTQRKKDSESMTEFCRNKVSLYQERLNGNIKSS